LEIRYVISEKLEETLFIQGVHEGRQRKVTFNVGDLTEDARKAYYTMFGASGSENLTKFYMADGKLWGDGSVSSDPPRIAHSGSDDFESDTLLTPENVSDTILTLYKQYQEIVAKCKEQLAIWQPAHEAYEAEKAKRDEERARQEAEDKKRREAEKVERLETRVKELRGYLTALIKVCDTITLERAGLVHGSEQEEEEELTEWQQEALETCGLDC